MSRGLMCRLLSCQPASPPAYLAAIGLSWAGCAGAWLLADCPLYKGGVPVPQHWPSLWFMCSSLQSVSLPSSPSPYPCCRSKTCFQLYLPQTQAGPPCVALYKQTHDMQQMWEFISLLMLSFSWWLKPGWETHNGKVKLMLKTTGRPLFFICYM